MALLGKSRKKPEEQSLENDGEIAAVTSIEASNEIAPVAADQEIRSQEAKNIVKNHVIGSMGISLVPIPLVDLFALTGIQLRMLHQLAKLYRIPFSENLGKSLIISLVGGVMPTSTAITLASFVKAVPGLGTATGIVSVTLLGGATTYAVGSVFMQHFESGGTLLNFEPKSMREHFAKELRQGKQVAANLKKSK
jgi:uncharacterized protein (DUF697 family)